MHILSLVQSLRKGVQSVWHCEVPVLLDLVLEDYIHHDHAQATTEPFLRSQSDTVSISQACVLVFCSRWQDAASGRHVRRSAKTVDCPKKEIKMSHFAFAPLESRLRVVFSLTATIPEMYSQLSPPERDEICFKTSRHQDSPSFKIPAFNVKMEKTRVPEDQENTGPDTDSEQTCMPALEFDDKTVEKKTFIIVIQNVRKEFM